LERNELFERLVSLEANVNAITQDMNEIKEMAVALVEENVALHIENDNLKRLMDKDELSQNSQPKTKEAKQVKKPLPSKDNLAMLYAEGFHICKGELFGKHRQGEDCLLCMAVLND
jgi:regulator of replication initiation timing